MPGVLALVRGLFPDAPVYLSGSVCFGNERPDSDIDLLVIVPDVAQTSFPDGKIEWENSDFKLVRAYFEEIPLHLHFGTFGLLEMFVQNPWRAYKFLKIEKLYDPNGVVQLAKDRIAPWFPEHPEVVKLWQEWLAQWTARNVSKGERQGELIKQYPDVDQWWPYLDSIIEEQKIAEQADAPDKK